MVRFYANVVKLRWLDEGYPRALAVAGEEMVKLERVHSDGVGVEVDEDKLKEDLLDDKDLDALVVVKIILLLLSFSDLALKI